MSAELLEAFSHKVKAVEDVLEIIGPFPRRKKVIMCHGVFDVVHPGHVRHLAYARSKADVLIVSITADRHISKGAYRPHIPERLRALSLAAFEMVDFVVVDGEPNPLKNLAFLRPDYFAKGFEYTSSGLPPATREEADTVEAYGGQMIFTPGDIVYSSSKFIELARPKVQVEKLLMLMRARKVSFDDLRQAVRALAGFKVHVVGDTIIDSYTRTALIGGQTKTPTFSVLYEGRDDYIGGAGIVAQHLRAAGAEVVLSTVLGEDALRDFTVKGLQTSGVNVRPIVDPTRPTTNKNAIIAGGYRLLKIDTLDNHPISEAILARLLDSVSGTCADAVVFSDFRHGIFNRATVAPLTRAIPQNAYRVADSQVASRWGNITEFVGFDLIAPNEREARFALGDQDATVGSLSTALLEACKCKTLILKLGDRGVFCARLFGNPMQADRGSIDSFAYHIDSFAHHVVDAVGAGDALLAYATLAMLATDNEVVAGVLGSLAAACECEIDGNVPVKPEDVIAKIGAVEKMAEYKVE
jgi:cytidyltransferase-like protein